MNDGYQIFGNFFLWGQTLCVDHYYFTVVTCAKILKPFIPKPHKSIFVRDNDLTYPVVLYFNHQIIEILPLII